MTPTTIPDKWLCGFLQAHAGATVADAVAHWQEQEHLYRLDMLAQHPDDRPEGWQDWPEAKQHAAA